MLLWGSFHASKAVKEWGSYSPSQMASGTSIASPWSEKAKALVVVYARGEVAHNFMLLVLF